MTAPEDHIATAERLLADKANWSDSTGRLAIAHALVAIAKSLAEIAKPQEYEAPEI